MFERQNCTLTGFFTLHALHHTRITLALRAQTQVRSIGALNLDVAINLRMDEISAFLVRPEVVRNSEGNYEVNYYAGGRGLFSTRGG